MELDGITYEDHVGMFLLILPIHEHDFNHTKVSRIYSGKKEIFIFGKWREIGEDYSFEIAKHVKSEKIEKFVCTVKSYIDHDFGKSEGWEILFNTNYTKLRKEERYKPNQQNQ